MILHMVSKAVRIWTTASLIACTIILIFANMYLQNPLLFFVSTALSISAGNSFYRILSEN